MTVIALWDESAHCESLLHWLLQQVAELPSVAIAERPTALTVRLIREAPGGLDIF